MVSFQERSETTTCNQSKDTLRYSTKEPGSSYNFIQFYTKSRLGGDIIFIIFISYLILLRRFALQHVDFKGPSDKNNNYNLSYKVKSY